MTIDESSKLLKFQVEPTCKEEESMMKVMILMEMLKVDSPKLLQFQVEPTCTKEESMMKMLKMMIKMKMLKIDSSILLKFQVEPTCTKEGSMVGGGRSLYTKRSCQGGGEVFLSLYFLMLDFVFSHIKLPVQKCELRMIVDEISTYPMQWWTVLENFEI